MAFCAYRADKRQEVFEQLCEESLFRCVYSHLRNRVMRETSMYTPSLQYDYSLVEVWEDAKELIRRISYSKHPDIRILHELDSLPQRYTHYSHDPRGVLIFVPVVLLFPITGKSPSSSSITGTPRLYLS